MHGETTAPRKGGVHRLEHKMATQAVATLGGAGIDEAGQEWRDAEAAAEAARGEAGGDRGQIGPGWRRRVATLARWEPSAWANMCRALRKRPHGVMQGETEDVVGD